MCALVLRKGGSACAVMMLTSGPDADSQEHIWMGASSCGPGNKSWETGAQPTCTAPHLSPPPPSLPLLPSTAVNGAGVFTGQLSAGGGSRVQSNQAQHLAHGAGSWTACRTPARHPGDADQPQAGSYSSGNASRRDT